MNGSEQAARWLTGRAQPPTWFRLVGVLFFIVVIGNAVSLADKRGAIVGTVAAVVYGLAGLPYLLGWQRVAGWWRQHPLLDSLLVVPFLFLPLAYLTKLSDGTCLLMALLGFLALVGLKAAIRHRRRRRT